MRALRAVPLLLLLCLCGCTYSSTFKRPYSQVESALLQRLDTDRKELGTGSSTTWIASRELARCLRKNGFIGISDYTAGQSIRLWTREAYDIGGIGHNELTINLQRVDGQRTRIDVDYSDRAVGFFLIPYAYATPGGIRERKIGKCLARLEGSPSAADRITCPEPRPIEQSCGRLQGRSCGPPGAVLPCETPSGPRLQCVCEGTWACGGATRPPTHSHPSPGGAPR
jgi:hypothetical protein